VSCIMGIDPGPARSALVAIPADRGDRRIVSKFVRCNDELAAFLRAVPFSDAGDIVAVESMASYGMPVGAAVFDSCVWIGRFVESWGGRFVLIKAPAVRAHMCGTPRAKKANVRQALIDMFPATGGGKRPQIGTKALPGPLHGFSNHLWSALAVAIAAQGAAYDL